MKKLYGKGLLFCMIILCFCICILHLSTREPARSIIAKWTDSEGFMEANTMLPSFAQANIADGTTQLLIGDSIANQLFVSLGEKNPQTAILTTNAALLMPGQYLLAKEYLENHPHATDVFLVIHPLPLTRTFDTEWGYRYGAMTYVETGAIKDLEQNTIDTMEDLYGRFFMNKEVVNLIEASPICRKLCLSYIDFNKENDSLAFPFEMADQYAQKLYDLCQKNKVTLHIHPSPVSEFYREQVTELAEAYTSTWMYSQFPNYFNEIMYYPDEWSEDLSHFSGEYAERDSLNAIIRQAYGTTPLSLLKTE